MPIGPDQMLSHYRLVEKLGEGGMGVVWKAVDTKLNREVAIKILPADLATDPERRLRFQREAQAAAALNHPNIAVIHEVDDEEGTDFIVMEFLEGKTLREEIGQRALPVKEWLRLVLPIAEGVAHAHKNGIIHRDLKPDNVMITGERQVKLLDFGLAKLHEPDKAPPAELATQLETISQEFTRDGKVFGTVAYMSPEQARGEATDHRSDLFSLGIVLYQMAGGRLPFKGKSTVETLHSIITAEAQPLSEISGEIPAEADRIIRKLMEKEPDRRYQNAADLVADLRNLKRDIDTDRVSVTSGIAPTVRAPRPRWWTVAGILALAAILIAGASFVYQKWLASESIAEHLTESHTVGVIGFENLQDPGDSDHISRMLVGLITTDLVESGGLEVVSSAKVHSALRKVSGGEFETSLAPEVARQAGVQMMLVGIVDQVGEGLLLTAELVDVKQGTAIGSFTKQVGSKSELFALAGAIADEVRRRFESIAPAAASRPFDLAQALTSSPEAYRQYAAGDLAFHEFRFEEAIEHLERAIREDPTFGLAYYRLGMAYDWSGLMQEALDTMQEGLPHIERLPERWQVVYRAASDLAAGGMDGPYEALSRLIQTVTDMPDAYYFLGEIATHFSKYWDPRRSRELFEKTLEIDPTYKIAFLHLIEDYILCNDLDAADRLLSHYRNEISEDTSAFRVEVQLQIARRDFDQAIARAKELMVQEVHASGWGTLMVACLEAGDWECAFMAADDATKAQGGHHRAMAYAGRGQAQLARGRFRAGIADLQEAMDQLGFGQVGGRWFLLDASWYSLFLVEALSAVGNTEEAIETAYRAIDIDPFAAQLYYALGRALIDAGRAPEALHTLTQLQEIVPQTSSPAGEFYFHLLATELRLAEGKIAEALAEIDEASAMPPEYRAQRIENLLRGRVLAASGNHAAALAAYNDALGPGNLPYWWIAVPVVGQTRALYSMARLEEEVGDLDSARQHYRKFLDRWGNADMPMVEVDNAKARLAALERP